MRLTLLTATTVYSSFLALGSISMQETFWGRRDQMFVHTLSRGKRNQQKKDNFELWLIRDNVIGGFEWNKLKLFLPRCWCGRRIYWYEPKKPEQFSFATSIKICWCSPPRIIYNSRLTSLCVLKVSHKTEIILPKKHSTFPVLLAKLIWDYTSYLWDDRRLLKRNMSLSY